MDENHKPVPVADFLKAVTPPAPRGTDAPRPAYDPAKWDEYWTKVRANCYAYALNFVPNVMSDFPQPGERGGNPDPDTTSIVFNRAVTDGLIPAPPENPPDVEGYYLAALFAEGEADVSKYHWYRKDADGMWSHKDGDEPATNLDLKGQPIAGPKAAARWIFGHFVSYFYVPNEGIVMPEWRRQAYPRGRAL